MQNHYQAQWVSRRRVNDLKKSNSLGTALPLNHLNGIILVEPASSKLGDGPVLSRRDADYELQLAWILEPQSTLRRARQLLGLGAAQLATSGS